MVLSAQTIRIYKPVEPFEERTRYNGMTYGLGPSGYDCRIDQDLFLDPGAFVLASTLEKFSMPNNLMGIVHDKSTWARRGIALQNTVIEPGWRGFLTLEITNHGTLPWQLRAGDPICQIVFHALDRPTDQAYEGKYQDQPRGPVADRFEQ